LTSNLTGLYLAPPTETVRKNAAIRPRFVCWVEDDGRLKTGRVVALGMLVLGACSAPRPSAETPEGASVVVSDSLATSLEVEVRPGSVRFVLHVTNSTSQPVALEFTSGQRYDFEVVDANGAKVWQWSADRMFAQVLGTESVAPGGSLKYEAEWRPDRGSGTFTAVGRVSATNRQLEQRARFELSAN
jgi:hypothetical protein